MHFKFINLQCDLCSYFSITDYDSVSLSHLYHYIITNNHNTAFTVLTIVLHKSLTYVLQHAGKCRRGNPSDNHYITIDNTLTEV